MLASVVLAPVRRGVKDAEIWGAGVVEDLCDVLVGVRVAVLAPAGPEVRRLLGERREAARILIGERVAPGGILDRELDGRSVGATAEPYMPVNRSSLVSVGSRLPADELDESGELRGTQNPQGLVPESFDPVTAADRTADRTASPYSRRRPRPPRWD